ncbi:hypothetical protein [Brevundimonas sp.]|uniref:hypothetical protein n=1 Tax=Brevundimonas sp. TaxID=1871086 RepID=UPI001D501E91|nr:hypothetical protein [Brevundimonas sp.]MBL0946883.1 hypothetical protein [Brevundimonas sp.]
MSQIALILAAFALGATAPQDPIPPTAPAREPTTWQEANYACRGQTWRRPSETVLACTERLVATDALSQPLPTGRVSQEPQCRRESGRNEAGTGFRFSVTCIETTTTPARTPSNPR